MENNLLPATLDKRETVHHAIWDDAPWNDEVSVPLHPKPFIEANTLTVDIEHLQHDCIIPVFSKDNERTISHPEFVEAAVQAAETLFGKENVSVPELRVSHTIKGRTPDAIHKPAAELLETEKTLYYERMAFAFEIPLIQETVGGNLLTLTAGGVRCYNHENLFGKKSLEHFKVFIGFKNMVCCNMCVSTDGFTEELSAASTSELMAKILLLFQGYSPELHLSRMQALTNFSITESQFAQILGKCRLHQHLPKQEKNQIPVLHFTDTQIHAVAKEYFSNENFGSYLDGSISLWNMYNLLTGANKGSYIDQFLTRSLNAFELTCGVADALHNPDSPYRWFIS